MSFRSVPAGNGVQWVQQGVQLAMQNPGNFALIALVMMAVGLVAVIPVLGILALIVFYPALLGGAIFAYREQAEGRGAQIDNLFASFKQPGKLGPMLMLCIPVFAAMVILVVLGVILIGGSLMAMFSGQSPSSGGMGLGMLGMLVFFLLACAIYIAMFCCMLFSVPRVMLDGIEPIAAIKESISACIANIGALLLLIAVLIGVSIVLAILMMIPILGILLYLAVTFVLAAVMPGVIFCAYRDVFAGAASAGSDSQIPPPQPPAQPM